MDIQITEIFDDDDEEKNSCCNLPANIDPVSLWSYYEGLKIKLQSSNETLALLASKILELNDTTINGSETRQPIKSRVKKFRGRTKKKEKLIKCYLKKLYSANLRLLRLNEQFQGDFDDLQKVVVKAYRLVNDQNRLLRRKLKRKIGWTPMNELRYDGDIPFSSNVIADIEAIELVEYPKTVTPAKDSYMDNRNLAVNLKDFSLNNFVFVTINIDWSSYAKDEFLHVKFEDKPSVRLIKDALRQITSYPALGKIRSSSHTIGIDLNKSKIYSKVLETLSLPTWKSFSIRDNVQRSLLSLRAPEEFKDVSYEFYRDISKEAESETTSEKAIECKTIDEDDKSEEKVSTVSSDETVSSEEKRLNDADLDEMSYDYRSDTSSDFYNRKYEPTLKTKRKEPLTVKEIEKKFYKKLRRIRRLHSSKSIINEGAIEKKKSIVLVDRESQVDCRLTESTPKNNVRKRNQVFFDKTPKQSMPRINRDRKINNTFVNNVSKNKSNNNVAIKKSVVSIDRGSQTDCQMVESLLDNSGTKKKNEVIVDETLQERPKTRINREKRRDVINVTKMVNNTDQDYRTSLKCLQEIIDLCSRSFQRDSMSESKFQNKKKPIVASGAKNNKNTAIGIPKTEEKKSFFDNYKKQNSRNSDKVPEMNKMHRIILENKLPQGVDFKFVSLEKSSVSKLFVRKTQNFF